MKPSTSKELQILNIGEQKLLTKKSLWHLGFTTEKSSGLLEQQVAFRNNREFETILSNYQQKLSE